ncbi:unnamed protein product, partial [Ilex paraguariensis]
MIVVELKVFLAKEKLFEAKTNCVLMTKEVVKLLTNLEKGSKRGDKIVVECQEVVLSVFEEIKKKTFKEAWGATLKATG